MVNTYVVHDNVTNVNARNADKRGHCRMSFNVRNLDTALRENEENIHKWKEKLIACDRCFQSLLQLVEGDQMLITLIWPEVNQLHTALCHMWFGLLCRCTRVFTSRIFRYRSGPLDIRRLDDPQLNWLLFDGVDDDDGSLLQFLQTFQSLHHADRTNWVVSTQRSSSWGDVATRRTAPLRSCSNWHRKFSFKKIYKL